VVWSGLDLFVRQGMGFAITVVLARLLVPEDFGTIALLSLFLGVAGVFVNAGFSAALIQRQDTTHLDESTVFWLNIGAASAMTFVLFAAAPWIADFFDLEVLTPLTMLMAGNILISALGSIHGTLMTKRLDFKTPMKIGVVSTLISGGVGMYMAWADYGVWALAGQTLASTVVGTALLWHFSTWRPAFAFSRDSLRRLFGFSGWVFGSAMLDTLYQRGYTLLIGKFYGTHDLGIYNRADNTQQLPANILTGVLSRVAFPLFSSVNHDKERLRSGVRMSVRAMMLVMVPSMMGLAVLAEPFIRVVFGEAWVPAAPIFQVLCVAGMLYPLHVINLTVLQAQGHANLLFRLEVAKKSIGTVLLIIGSFFGVMGIAWSRVIQSVIALMINSHYTNKFLGYGMREQIKDCLPSFLLSAAMAGVVAMADVWIEIGGATELLLMISIGSLIYLAGNMLLGINAFKEVVGFVKGAARAH
jgi:O-antigen/teichoic acid export membrane protein